MQLSERKGYERPVQPQSWLYCLLARALSHSFFLSALFPLFYRLNIYRQPVNKCSSCLIMWTCRGDANLSIERTIAQRLKLHGLRFNSSFSSSFQNVFTPANEKWIEKMYSTWKFLISRERVFCVMKKKKAFCIYILEFLQSGKPLWLFFFSTS